MEQEGWPPVGQQSVSLAAHAASVKVDIDRLNDCIRKGADHIPKDVFLEFCTSVDALLDKVLDLPDLKTFQRAIQGFENSRLRTNIQPHAKKWEQLEGSPLEVTSRPIQNMDDNLVQDLGPRASSKLVMRRRQLEDEQQILTYGPLDTSERLIRLVQIDQVEDPRAPPTCHLSVVSLDAQPKYVTLSYVWGDAKDTQPILLNDRRFDVTQNLKRALEHLRNRGVKKPIWIDAICINQADVKEREHQVQMMGQIYENCLEVFVYLGEPELHRQTRTLVNGLDRDQDSTKDIQNERVWTGDDADIPRVKKILSYAQLYADQYPEPPSDPDFEPLALLVCLMRLLAGDVHLQDIPMLNNANLLNECVVMLNIMLWQPWWNRIWVVQEFVLPPKVNVMYGRFTAPLHMLVEAAQNLQNHRTSCCAGNLDLRASQESVFMYFKRAMAVIEQTWVLRQTDESLGLPTLLDFYHTKDATNPRDRVYGLLGLVRSWGKHEPIEPEYTIDPRVLYERVALNWMKTTSNLDFLVFAAGIPARKKQQNDMWDAAARMLKNRRQPGQVQITSSSWAPDWTLLSQPQTVKAIADRKLRYQLFNASPGRTAIPTPENGLSVRTSALTSATVIGIYSYAVGQLGHFKPRPIGLKPLPVEKLSYHEMAIRVLEGKPTNVQEKVYKSPYNGLAYYTAQNAPWFALVADSWIESSPMLHAPTEIQKFRRATVDDLDSLHRWRAWKEMKGERDGKVGIGPIRSEFADQETFQRVLEAELSMHAAANGRRVVTLDSGFVGMLHEDAREGDEVVVFIGARTPYVVRALGKAEIGISEKPITIWAIIGECYVIGAMDGEIIKRNREGGYTPPEERFYI